MTLRWSYAKKCKQALRTINSFNLNWLLMKGLEKILTNICGSAFYYLLVCS